MGQSKVSLDKVTVTVGHAPWRQGTVTYTPKYSGSLSECGVCSSLVQSMAQRSHAQWHVDEGHIQLVRAAAQPAPEVYTPPIAAQDACAEQRTTRQPGGRSSAPAYVAVKELHSVAKVQEALADAHAALAVLDKPSHQARAAQYRYSAQVLRQLAKQATSTVKEIPDEHPTVGAEPSVPYEPLHT